MKLTPAEIEWVTQRMGCYTIPFQEIFDELLDHILTAIEQARAEGSDVAIEVLFQDIVEEQFGGYQGIEAIVDPQVKAYRHKLNKSLWKIYGSYLDWKTVVFIIAICGISLCLPPVPLIGKGLVVVLFISALIPILFIMLKVRTVKVNKGKKSLLSTYLITYSCLPMWLMTLFLNLPNIIDDITDNGNYIKHYINLHAVIPAFMLTWFIIYAISCIELFKRELSLYKA